MTEKSNDIPTNDEERDYTGKVGDSITPTNELENESDISSNQEDLGQSNRKYKLWHLLLFTLATISLAILLYKGVVYIVESNEVEETTVEVQEVQEVEEPVETEETIDFDALIAQNPDTKAWLTIPGTNIDYVVVQADEEPTSDSDYFYLHNDFNGNPSENGTLFFEPTDIVGEDIAEEANYYSQNLIVFGHNMKDDQMFGQLTNYADEQFYKEHPTIILTTPDGEFTYEIFAVAEMAVTPTEEDPEPFYYIQPDFATQDDFMAYIEKAKSRSIYDIPVEVGPGDEILTLSTCSDTDENARFVVFAKKVESKGSV